MQSTEIQNDGKEEEEDEDLNIENKKKIKRQRNPLNISGLRSFALAGGFVQMVSPKAYDAMQCYIDKYLLKPIIKEITLYITDKITENNTRKAFRIVQTDKLKNIIQKYVVHDLKNEDDGSFRKKGNMDEFAFHPQTFKNHVLNLTDQVCLHKNIQWSSKCMEMFQLSIEHELHIVMCTCGRVIWTNAGGDCNKKKLKLTHKDVRFVFEARYIRNQCR